MGRLGLSAVSIRFRGDDLVPESVTTALGVAPDLAYAKGGAWKTSSGRPMVGRSGLWSLRVADRSPADLDAQIAELFALLPSAVDTIAGLSSRYDGELFVGLFMHETPEGISLSAETIAAVAERGLQLGLDMYGPFGDDK